LINPRRSSRDYAQVTETTEEHLAARLELLAAEKEHTRRGDELARIRRFATGTPSTSPIALATSPGRRR
jgi:predicted dithiol-disulfide oxidoreductase (DUF899 family)